MAQKIHSMKPLTNISAMTLNEIAARAMALRRRCRKMLRNANDKSSHASRIFADMLGAGSY
jgi:hypothetical protein